MDLPNYFLVDLPPEAVLTTQMVLEACQTLKRNRAQYLASRSTQSLVHVLAELGESWLQPDYPFRQMLLARAPAATEFSPATLSAGLESFFRQLTRENLQALLTQELGHAQRLDELCSTADEQKQHRAAMVRAPELVVRFAAGNIPNATLLDLVLGLLVRSAQFIKCATGASLAPRLFAHSLYELEPKLASCLELVEWPGGTTHLEDALFSEADCVTATGSDESLAAIQARLPRGVRFLGYGHKVSFGYVTREVLSGFQAKKMVARAARDVAAWNQLGCLSPHVIYVETGGGVTPELFAQMLSEELARLEQVEPRGPLSSLEAAGIASRRDFYQVRAAAALDTRLWVSDHSTAWTVVFEGDPRFQLSCLNRFIYVKPVGDLTETLQAADAVRNQISTVGLAADETRAPRLALQLAQWGARRICPLGQMQNPPLTWRHDGRPALADLLTWADWEMS